MAKPKEIVRLTRMLESPCGFSGQALAWPERIKKSKLPDSHVVRFGMPADPKALPFRMPGRLMLLRAQIS